MLDPKPGEFFIDGTVNGGGHAAALIARIGRSGRFLGVDLDAGAVERFVLSLRGSVSDRGNLAETSGLLRLTPRNDIKGVVARQGNYADLPGMLERAKLPKADGLLLDLGFSSDQLSGRGFSFAPPAGGEPLAMTYDAGATPVWQLLRSLSERELERVIREYGEERYARPVAEVIAARERKQPIMTTGELASVVAGAVPKAYEHGRIHPATRTFQALRIYANGELESLSRVLGSLGRILKPGGRVAVISFHSLEDRIVKNALRDLAKQGFLELMTKKPVTPSLEEIAANSRSRSAKLRAAIVN